ncbi:MAG: T9SS type B sorting domain-containing protein [Crocinitomicaceae bacterium]
MKGYFLSSVFIFLLFSAFGQEIEQMVGNYKFIENKGQWPEQVLYKANVTAGNIWLEKKGILYQFTDQANHHHASFDKHETTESARQQLVYAKFLNSNENFKIESLYPSTVYYNYFIGNDRSKWTSKNRSYNTIKYKSLYKGIDLVFYEKDQALKYEYHVAPKANYSEIKIEYKGANKIKHLKNGNVIIYTGLGQIIEQKPYVYQIKNGRVIEISSKFNVDKNNVLSFQLGDYDHNVELVIDPVLIFATYNGASSDNFGMTATYAYDGKAYAGGIVFGNSYPTVINTYDTLTNFTGLNSASYGISDVFISKYNETGTDMLWTTFIGGGNDFTGTETVHSLICDQDNNIYLYGATSSLDFPTVNAFQSGHAGGEDSLNFYRNGVFYTAEGTDIFVAKFSDNGANLLGSTYIGGSGNDGVNYNESSLAYIPGANPTGFVYNYGDLTTNYGDQFRGEIMLDEFNNVLVTSSTHSTDFPTQNPFQLNNAGMQDGVLFKLSADFSSLLWSSYYGGSGNDASYSVKIDSSFNVIIAGGTSSNNLPDTTGGLNTTYLDGGADGFVAKIEGDGSAIVQSTYIGTPAYDQCIFVEIDRDDNIYIVGQSLGNIPLISANYSNPNSGQFIMKLNPSLTAIEYSTVFGNGNGQINISPAAFLVDVCGNVYVSGWGRSILLPNGSAGLTGMPISPDAFQSAPQDGFDFYLFVLERNAENLLYGSYIGGEDSREHVDGGTSRFDKKGVIYQSVCAGCSNNDDFPVTPGAWSATNNSTNCNNLLFKFDFQIVPDAEFTVSSIQGCSPLTINFANQSNDPNSSVWDLSSGGTIIQGGVNPIVEYTESGTYEAVLHITDAICNLTDTAKRIITVLPTPSLELTNDTIICGDDITNFDLIANSFGTATRFTWADNINFNNPLNSGILDSIISISPSIGTVFYCKISNGNSICDIIDSVVVQFSGDIIDLSPPANICLGDQVNLFANKPAGSNVLIDWSPNIDLIEEDQVLGTATAKPSVSQYFYATATINGCPFYDSVWVNVDNIDEDLIEVIANPTELAKGGASELIALPNISTYSYSWTPSNLVLNPNSRVTKTYPLNDNTTFTATLKNGVCTKSAKLTVRVLEFVCGDIYVFVPTAFTPGQDGNNDMVFVRGQNISEIQFKIFDRWGELVFETNDQSIGWDGTFKGKMLDPDVYVYHLTAICVDGQENLIKGNITLLR